MLGGQIILNPRDAIKEAISTWIDVMVEERFMEIPVERRESLSTELANSDSFLFYMEDVFANYLEEFGDNHDLYDLFG